jgi:hypothetical protein
MRRRELKGQRFGRLVAECRFLWPGQDIWPGQDLWVFRCDCGEEVALPASYVTRGDTKSCGCLQSEVARRRLWKHGHKAHKKVSPEYRTWAGMRTRCLDEGHHSYRNYGARGITICERWLESFEAFFEDMGPKPSPKHEIERVDNDGPYSPENCVWATHGQQMANTRATRLLTVNGQTLPIKVWARTTGINPATLYSRINAGVAPEFAIIPPRK